MIKKFIDKDDGRKIFYHFNFFGVKFRLAVKTNRAFKITPNHENYKKRTYLIPNRIYYTKMGYSYDGKNLYTLMKNSEVKVGAK